MKEKALNYFVVILSIQLSCTSFLFAVNQQESTTYLYKSTTIYTNYGDKPLKLDETYLNFLIFMNTSWQTVHLLDVNHPYTKIVDVDGNLNVLLDLPVIPPNENTSVVFSLKIIEVQQKVPSINIVGSGNLYDIPNELVQEYCVAKDSWPTNDPTLLELASDIWLLENKTTNVLRIVCALADWIGTNISPVNNEVPLYPTETLNSRKGDCDDQTNLLITLCRILDIPSYLQIGGLQSDRIVNKTYYNGYVTSSLNHISYHAWAAIYIPPWGWLPFDMTLGWTRQNPLTGITKAPVWDQDTIQGINITESNWVGEGQILEQNVLDNSLYIHYEDELKTLNSSSINDFFPLTVIAITLFFIVLVIYFKRTSFMNLFHSTNIYFLGPVVQQV